MKVRKEGIDDRDVRASPKIDAAVSFVLGRPMHPHAVKHDVVHSAGGRLYRSEAIHERGSWLPGYFEADQAIMIGAGSEKDRT